MRSIGRTDRGAGVLLLILVPFGSSAVRLEQPAHRHEVVLKWGETAKFGDLEIGFVNVQGDSRCPTDVECIWEGDAAIAVSAAVPDVEPVQRVLHTHRGFEVDFIYEGHRIALLRVAPEPRSDRPIDRGDYLVTILITDAKVAATEPSTWGNVKNRYR